MPAPPTHHPKKGRGHTPTMELYGTLPRDPQAPRRAEEAQCPAKPGEQGPYRAGPATFSLGKPAWALQSCFSSLINRQ